MLQWGYYFLVIMLLSPSRGDYILRARVHSYDNPTNFCASCGEDRGCCDDFERRACTGNRGCDNVFFFCVRSLGTPIPNLQDLLDTFFENPNEDRTREQCMQSPAVFRSEVNENDGFINFSGPAFLGIPNPMEFHVNASEWEGSQLYLDVSDEDDNNEDEFIDSFAIDIEPVNLPAGSGMTVVMSFPGIFGFANVTLSFEVECQPGFVGETCVPICSTDPCSNNGTCLQSASGSTCTCSGDFTGETCETRINDCQDVDCNTGTCVDGVQSFTCQCEEGVTGEFCEERTATISTTITSDDNTGDSSSSNVGAVAGAVVGSIIAIFIIAIAVAFGLLLLWRHRKGNQANGHSTTLDNPVYGIRGESDQRDLDNPIYGLEEDNVKYNMPHSNVL